MTRAWHRRCLLLLIAFSCLPVAAGAAEPLELAVKAAYLYKLAPFVDWPANEFAAADSPFDLCVIGDDPFGPVLDRVVTGQRIDGHPIVVHRLPTAQRNSGCELAFVAGSKVQSAKDGLRQLSGQPILTVTDNETTPGVVDFVIDEGRVRFRIDNQAAADNGLTISSKLLSLAVSVAPRRSRPTER